MQSHHTICPVCTLYMREGITLQAHLDTHPKDQVIEALLKFSNGMPMGSSHFSTPAPANPYISMHHTSPYSQVNPSTPYVPPTQTQMTTAVTYQHFMTSSGSNLLPHYVSSSSSSNPVFPNTAMNYGPNPNVTYAQTLYNPLYNPYIPQPYPFTPTILTSYSSMPSTSSNAGTVHQESRLNTSLSSSLNTSFNTTLSNSLSTNLSTTPNDRLNATVSATPNETEQTNTVKMCSVGTSTKKKKKVLKNSGSKKPVSKTPNKKSKIVQKGKSAVAKKSVINDDERGANLPVSKKTSTSAVTPTTTVIRTIRPKTTAESSSNNSRIVSPSPSQLKVIAEASMAESSTPPPPPQREAPAGTSVAESMTPPPPQLRVIAVASMAQSTTTTPPHHHNMIARTSNTDSFATPSRPKVIARRSIADSMTPPPHRKVISRTSMAESITPPPSPQHMITGTSMVESVRPSPYLKVIEGTSVAGSMTPQTHRRVIAGTSMAGSMTPPPTPQQKVIHGTSVAESMTPPPHRIVIAGALMAKSMTPPPPPQLYVIAGASMAESMTPPPHRIMIAGTSVAKPMTPPPPPQLRVIAGASMAQSRTTTPPPQQNVISGTSESMTLPLEENAYFMPRIISCIKREDVPGLVTPQAVSTIINRLSNSPSNLNYDYMEHNRSMGTVIVENCPVEGDLSEMGGVQQTEESSEPEGDDSLIDTRVELPKDCLYTVQSDEFAIDDHASKLEEYPEEDGEVRGSEEVEETTTDVEDRQERIFHMIEVHDNKNDIADEVLSQDISREVENEDVNCDGSDRYIQEAYDEDSNREKANTNYPEFMEVESDSSDNKMMESESESRAPPNEFGYFNKEYTGMSRETNRSVLSGNIRVGESNIREPEISLTTYADLHPAKTIFRDSEEAEPPNFNNVTDGVNIVSNNQAAERPSDESIRAASKLRGGSDPVRFLKSEYQGNGSTTIADSVVQIVSWTGDSKGEFNSRDSYSASTSHMSSESHLDNSEMSPLALNIQADESMPARGELSEQESLGAENTTWNLYHGSNAANIMRSIEEWRNENAQSISIIGMKKNSKTFRCSICNEMFSCPKERRVHKNAVHAVKNSKTEKGSPGKKPRKYECNFCNEVFASIRDRKQHVTQNHILSMKNRKTGSKEIKRETGELYYTNGIVVGPDGGASGTAEVKNETEQEQKFKTEMTTGNVTRVTVGTPAKARSSRASGVDPSRMKFCDKCSLSFDGAKKLREHLRLSHGDVRFKCDKCSSCFDAESDYKDHLRIHPLACEKCGKTFYRKPNLSLHMKRHLEVKPYECSLCPKSFITRQKLEEHMNGHSGKKPLKCSFCEKTFSRHSNLVQHRNLHHFNVRKKSKDYVCRCGEVFHSQKKLEWHKEIHDRKPKPCPFCSQKFIHSSSVTRHIRRAHVPEYLPGDNREMDNVNCPICEKVYLRSSLVVHLRLHKGEKPFQCKICSKKFSTKWNLELHNWTHQSRNNMPYKCNVCKSAFFRESDFISHLNSHRNYKPFTCNICGQKFIRKYSCIRHQEEHKKAKQFVCAVNGCEKSFHRGYYLRDHMKVHTGLRPHTCHICGKSSSTKSNHNKHVRIHDTREPVNTEN